MEITINRKVQTIPEDYSVEQLLSQLVPENTRGIAVAVNQTIVPRGSWSSHKIQSNDDVMIIKATQGG